MRKLVFLLLLVFAGMNSMIAQQKLTLDLSKPLNPASFTYESGTGEWAETYNEADYPFIEFENFAFSHLISGDGSGGMYWDGFTVCTSGDNTDYGQGNSANWIPQQWGNMAGGGIKTDANGNALKNQSGKVQVQQGIPYLLGYWGYFTEVMMRYPRCQQIILTGQHAPYKAVGVYVNISPWAYYGNLNGDGFARALDQDGDYFKLIIHGLDKNYEDNGLTVEHYLAKNEGGGIGNLKQSPDWEWVDLSPLGEVYGFYCTMESTDEFPPYGPNTATYYCMDKLQVQRTTVDVTVRMNAISQKMKLKSKTSGEYTDVGSPTSNNYTFDVAPGNYIVEAYASDGITLNGTIELTVTDEPAQTFQFYTVTAYATNAGWTLNTDYTINLSVSSREGGIRNTALGSSTTAGRATFLVYSGDTYYVQYVPSQSRAAEGYLTYDGSGTVTANTTKSGAIPMGYNYTLTVPKGATAFVGRKGAHFQRFVEMLPESVNTTDENTVYTYKLAGSQEYNYRISQPGKVTYATVFTKKTSSEDVIISPEMLAGNPQTIDHDVSHNSGYNVADIFLNINEKGHLQLSQGNTCQLVNLRIWQTTNSITGNYFIEPDFHYTVINESGATDNSVVTVDGNGKMTAVGNGTAIVLVTYDAINVAGAVGGTFFSAIWPENTGVFVVSVGAAEANITPNMTINETLNSTANANKNAGINVDAELDVFYYLADKDGYDYTFTPAGVASVSLAQLVIGTNMTTYTGFSTSGVTANIDGSYTVRLVHGRNIVKLTSATGSVYQVLTAKPVTYILTNASRAGESIRQGDKVSVRFNTLYHPNTKLSGVYNMSASIQYTANGSVVTGTANQYTFANTANAQTVSATIPAEWSADEFAFTGGVLKSSGFGDPFGNHRDITLEIGRNPNFTAVMCTGYFGALPNVVITGLQNTATAISSNKGNKAAIYPNPFTDYIIVSVMADGQVAIYDLSGKQVLTATVQAGSNRIDASALPKGVYVLKTGETTVKIVK